MSLAACGTASLLPRSLYAFPLGLPPGIQLYAVRRTLQADPQKTLQQLYTIGYRQVETAGYAGVTAAEFRRWIDAAQLTCPSAHVQFTPEDFSQAFSDARALGAHYAVSSALAFVVRPLPRRAPGSPMGPFPQLQYEDFMKMADLMNRIGAAAQADGLTYAYHNHNMEFVRMPNGQYGYDLLLKHTNPKTVKFEADCGWMMAAGVRPEHYFRHYPDRYREIHVKDFQPLKHPTNQLAGPDRPEGTDLGRGFIKYGPIFAAARAAGIQHVYAEQEPPFAPSELAAAQVDYRFLASWPDGGRVLRVRRTDN